MHEFGGDSLDTPVIAASVGQLEAYARQLVLHSFEDKLLRGVEAEHLGEQHLLPHAG